MCLDRKVLCTFIKIDTHIYTGEEGGSPSFFWSDSIVPFGLHRAVDKAETDECFYFFYF